MILIHHCILIFQTVHFEVGDAVGYDVSAHGNEDGRNAFIDKKLVFYFSDSRTLNCGGIGRDGINVELLIVHLILNS